jgi:23S rRNA (adenine2030-N6)-methyltransferase
MNYQHSFHAGNFADLFKHCVLCCCLNYLQQKEKPLLVIDTHAGLGKYQLNQQNIESNQGIYRLIHQVNFFDSMPSIFWQILAKINLTSINNLATNLKFYAGSSLLMKYILQKKSEDWQIFLAEKNQEIYYQLKKHLAGNKNIFLNAINGFDLLKTKLPPLHKRCLALIDPPYEKTHLNISPDYQNSILAFKEAKKRLANGVYLWWYPITSQTEILKNTINEIKKLNFAKIMQINIGINNLSLDNKMQKCGMLIINPPYILKEQLDYFLPNLLSKLTDKDFEYNFLTH